MKRLGAFVAILSLLPNLALAQVQPLTVTFVQPAQPQSGQAYPGQTVAAVAVTIQSNSLAHITGIQVQKVGSANNAAFTGLQANTSATSVVGTSGGFGSNNTVTIPVSFTTDTNSTQTVLISALMVGDLTAYAGQSFELNITGVTTDAVITKGTLPVYGAQFTLATGVAKPTCSLSASSGTYTIGQTVNVSWKSTNAPGGGTISGLGAVGPSGLQGILPGGQSQTLVGTFTGPGGTGTCSLTLTLTSSTGGVISGGGGVGTTGGVNNPSGTFGSTNGGTVTPGIAAGSNPTVPTGSAGATPASDIIPCSGLDCRPCDIAALFQNIINYAIGLTIPLAAVLFAYAGILYFTSATNPANIERARATFKTVFWGFLIVISAWLVVQLLLRVLLGPTYYQNWNVIQCSSATRAGTTSANSTNVGSFFSNLGGINTQTPGVYVSNSSVDANSSASNQFGSVPTCTAGYTYLQDAGQCSNAEGTDFKDPTYVLNSNGPIANGSVAAAASNYYGANTSAGPDGGNLACAWAVNNVLQSAGIAPVDGNSVYSMEQVLDNGRGTLVDNTSAKAGDIVIEYNNLMSHVGICQNDGCSQVISNSSSKATFTNVTDQTMGTGIPPRIYRLNN